MLLRLSPLGEEDQAAAQDSLEKTLQTLPDFAELVSDIMDKLRKRFDQLDEGLSRLPGGWPASWVFTSNDRDKFIYTIRRLSSNWAAAFGTLLTPLVDGIRIRGPFAPRFSNREHRLVLLDGEGLGHAKDSAAALTSRIASRFDQVDVILLVDTATMPMLETPTSVISIVAASGHYDKLAIAFTSFDLLKGQDNLPTFADKQDHVMGTVNQALDSLRKIVGDVVIRSISRNIDERCFMLSYIDRSITDKNSRPAAELLRLLNHCEKVGRADATSSTEPVKVYPADGASVSPRPVYKLDPLRFAIESAAEKFHRRWDAVLDLGGARDVEPAHWNEVKALNRRVVEHRDNYEFKDLKPVADLVKYLATSITRYLSETLQWESRQLSEKEIEVTLGRIQREVFKGLEPLAKERLMNAAYDLWEKALDLSGLGSITKRAKYIRKIYQENVPIPEPELTFDYRANALARELESLVRKAIEAVGGVLTR